MKVLSIALFALALFATSVQAGSIRDKVYGSVEVSEVTSIYDGDTFRANIKGWPEILGYRIPIRVAQIDTPEMRGKCKAEIQLARKAKQEAVGFLRGGKKIVLTNMKRGKYFRIVADVMVDGKSLGTHLVSKGLAVAYDGGKKSKDWCR